MKQDSGEARSLNLLRNKFDRVTPKTGVLVRRQAIGSRVS